MAKRTLDKKKAKAIAAALVEPCRSTCTIGVIGPAYHAIDCPNFGSHYLVVKQPLLLLVSR